MGLGLGGPLLEKRLWRPGKGGGGVRHGELRYHHCHGLSAAQCYRQLSNARYTKRTDESGYRRLAQSLCYPRGFPGEYSYPRFLGAITIRITLQCHRQIWPIIRKPRRHARGFREASHQYQPSRRCCTCAVFSRISSVVDEGTPARLAQLLPLHPHATGNPEQPTCAYDCQSDILPFCILSIEGTSDHHTSSPLPSHPLHVIDLVGLGIRDPRLLQLTPPETQSIKGPDTRFR